MSNINFPFQDVRTIITRTVLAFVLFWLCVRYASHTLPSQLAEPVLTKTGYDLSYALYKGLGLGDFFTQNKVAGWLFNITLFSSGILLLFFPRKQTFAVLFSICFAIVYINTNLFVLHSQHYLGLLFLAMFIFIPKSDKTFSLLWEGLRYYACWAYFSTFLLKLVYGAMWQWDYGLYTIQSQLATYIFQNPDTIYTQLYKWFLLHPDVVNVGQKFVFLVEGAFIIGFFTKKYDYFLMACALLIFITTTLFADVFFTEHLGIILLALVPAHKWKKWNAYFFKGLSGSLAK